MLRPPLTALLLLAAGLTADRAPQLRILRALPQGDAGPLAVVTVSFDRPIAASLEGVAVDPARILHIEPAVAGKAEWRDPVTLRFTPAAPLAAGTSYRVTVDTAFRSMDGARLSAPYSFAFRIRGPELLTGLPVGPAPYKQSRTTNLAAPTDSFSLVVSRTVTPAQVARWVFIETDRSCATGRQVIPLRLVDQHPVDPKEPWEIREAGGYQRDRRADSLRRVLVLAPTAPLPLHCSAGLVAPPFFDDDGAELPGRFPFSTYPLFALNVCKAGCQVDPTGPISISFTTPVRGAEVMRHVTIRPAARVAVDDTDEVSTSFAITPDALKPRTGYAVVVDTGLRDVFGQSLTGNPVTVAVTSGYAPSLDYANGRMLVERNGYRTLAVRHVNVDTLYVAVRPVTDSMYAEMLKRGPWGWGQVWDALDSTSGVQAIRVHADSDRSMVTGVALPNGGATRGATPAAFAVKIRRNVPDSMVRNAWRSATVAMVQVTDLALTSRAGGTEATVWVTGVGDGRARPGARVELHAPDGRLLAQGTSDSTGLARFTNVRGLEGSADANEDDGDGECDEECGGGTVGGAYVTARLGDDRAVLGVNESSYDLSPWQFNAYAAYGIARYQVAATVFTERDIYRPGEPVYAKVIVRAGPLGTLRPPAGDSVKVTFSDRDGGTFSTSVRPLSEFGTAADSIRLPNDAKLGQYNVTAQLFRAGQWRTAASDGYRVAEYRAPEFVVSAVADSGLRFPGDSVRTSLEARYLFGAPMARAAVHWTARLTPDWFDSSMIPGLGDGWYLGAQGFWWEPDQRETTVTSEGTDTLDATGHLVFTAPTGTPPKGRPASVAIEATVTDVNRRSVAATATARVHPASFYVAAKPTGDFFWTGGKPQRVDVLAVRPDGRKVPGVAVMGTIIRREWHQVARTRTGYSNVEGQWVEDTVARCALTTAATPVSCGITPAQGGSYVIRFDAKDEAGRAVETSFYQWATGPGWVPWNDENRFKMDIIPDKERYAPGDTATLLLASPFTGAEAWFTVEREGILEQRRFRITDGATRIRLPITERFAPNVFVSVVVVRGRSGPAGTLEDPGRPTLRVGYAQLRVTPEVKRMQVTVAPARAEYRPGDTATVRVTARSARGGERSEVTLWAVDEGVLSLTGFKTPDPLDRIYAERGLGQTLSSGLVSVAPQVLREESRQLKGLLNAGQGGGREGADVLRSRFQTTAFFLGSVVTGTDGEGVARVKLPDNLTTFRVMAVAVTAGDRYGSASAPLLVTRPLLARPSLPRFFRSGDKFLAGVVVNQRAGGTPTVAVDVTAQGVTLTGPAHRTATLEAGRGKEVRFDFTGLPGDSASFRFDVAGRGDRDAVLTRLPIRPDFHPRATTVAGVVEDTATVTVTLPAGTDPARTRLELSTGTSPWAMLRGLDREMRLYEWYCTEQVVSTATPLLELWKAQQLGPDTLVRADAKARLELAVRMIVRRQRDDGAIALWDDGQGWSSPWLTAYAADFLANAKGAGFTVDPVVLSNAARWLAQRARDNSVIAAPVAYWQTTVQAQLRERLAAADFVSRMGQPDLATENELMRSVALLSWEDRVRLAQVLIRRNAVRNARAILDPIWRSVKVEGSRAVLPDSVDHPGDWYFYSHIRPMARLLQATLAVDSGNVLLGPMVQALLQRGRAERARGWYWWWNTQDMAYAATALAEYGRRQAAAAGRGLTITAAGRPFLTLAAGDTTLVRMVGGPGLLVPVGTDSVRLTLKLKTGGAGTGLFYVVTAYEAPRAQPVTPDDRGIRVERWYEPMSARTPIGSATEGDLVRVKVRITVPVERQFVVVEDPLPAGLEAVDLSLRTESRQGVTQDCDSYSAGDNQLSGWNWYYGSWEGCYWSPFDHKELRDDRVVWVATILWPGTHTLSYIARATTPGTYKRSTAWAEEMYNPGVNGRTEGGVFVVRAR